MFRVSILQKMVECISTDEVIALIEAERQVSDGEHKQSAEVSKLALVETKAAPNVKNIDTLLKVAVKLAAKRDADIRTKAIAALSYILDEKEIAISKLAKKLSITHKGKGTTPLVTEITSLARQSGVRVNTVVTFRKTSSAGTLYCAGKNTAKVLNTALKLRSVTKA